MGVFLTGCAGGILGLLIGSTMGGNIAVDFQFAGNRGYEAAGLLGALIGLAVGIVGGAIAFACFPRNNTRP